MSDNFSSASTGSTNRVSNRDFAELLSEKGPFANIIAGFKSRTQQIQMAEFVRTAIDQKELLVVEAGTGVGKTLAYLVPAVLSGKKIVISTGTKYLQDQIYFKDLPAVVRALDIPANIALLKGRANYLCLEYLDRQRKYPELEEEQRDRVERIYFWSRETDSGDIADFPDLGEDNPFWSSVTSTPENCLGSECSFYDDCFVVKARKRAAESDVVIVNHYLLLADMTLKDEGFGALLPVVDTVIVDEAHKLNGIADDFFGESLSSRQVQALIKDVKQDEIYKLLPELRQCIDMLETSIRSLIGTLQEHPERGDLTRLEKSDQFVAAKDALGEALIEFEALLKKQRGRDKVMDNFWERAEVFAKNFQIGFSKDESRVRWYQRHKRSFNFHISPIDIEPLLRDKYSLYNANWIYTSATLSVDGSFDYIRSSLGIGDDGGAEILDSPFDFIRQAALYLPQNLPNPNTPGYTERFIRATYPLLELSEGNALFLFTSHKALKESAKLLGKHTPFKVLVQGEAPKLDLVQTFSAERGSLLLGTMGFWEGMDVRGSGLRCVIIDRLPFAQYSDPLVQGRSAAINEGGGNFFAEVALPEAVVLLRQGVGRLIRDENDRGVVMIGDTRITKRNYGQTFLKSLPTMKQFSKVESLRGYLCDD